MSPICANLRQFSVVLSHRRLPLPPVCGGLLHGSKVGSGCRILNFCADLTIGKLDMLGNENVTLSSILSGSSACIRRSQET